MVCYVINGKHIPHVEELVETLRELEGMTSITFSSNTKRTNVIMGDSYEIIWGQGYITDYIGDVKYQISPLSFYQVNPVQTDKLYGLALEYADLKGNETVWDLYCGIGTISLFLAQKAKRFTELKLFHRPLKMLREMQRSTDLKMQNFMLEKQKKFCQNTMKNMQKHMTEKELMQMLLW